MKRFVCAIILLAVTICAAVLLTLRTSSLANDLELLVDSTAKTEEICSWWEENEKWFSVLLPHHDTEEIEALIESLEDTGKASAENYSMIRAELKSKIRLLKESMLVNAENIF